MTIKYKTLPNSEIETRIDRGLGFFRTFKNKSDSLTYKEAVMRFCDLVEEYKNRQGLEYKAITEAYEK